MSRLKLSLLACAIWLAASPVRATVVTGTLHEYEFTQITHFGDLYQGYSTHQWGQSGWFYGSIGGAPIWSNADVANAGANFDLATVDFSPDAVTPYVFNMSYVSVSVGETVLFKGTDSWGARKIDA